jgi:predicted nucleotide-binding protein
VARRTRSANPPSPPAPTLLRIPVEQARQQIAVRVQAGKDLASRSLGYDELKDEATDWQKYNWDLLRRIFSNEDIANEVEHAGPSYMLSVGFGGGAPAYDYGQQLADRVRALESVLNRLELFVDPLVERSASTNDDASPELQQRAVSRKIFIVHGHDDLAKSEVARFLQKAGFEPIILHEQASGGRTVIEKLEHYSNVGFAVVLLTPDDIGGGSDAAKFHPRARQNVIGELFYFVGKLGRPRVCALKKGELEFPSDIAGVIYTEMDDRGAWRSDLLRELAALEYEVDWAKALG